MALLKDLIVTGASRLINGLLVNGGLVADSISATTANINNIESSANTGLILNGKTSTMLLLNGTNYAGIASNGNFYFYKNNIRFLKVTYNGYGEIYKNHSSTADYGIWFRDIASTINGDIIAGINVVAHPNTKIGNSLIFKRGDTNYTIYGTHNLILSDGLTSTIDNNNITTIKVDYENISITTSQISNFPSSMPASDVSSWAKQSSKPSYSLSEITSASDVLAIEALTGTSGFLKKTAANTWSLDTTTYSTTDEKVKQTATSNENYNLRLLLSSSANDNTLTAGTYKSTNLYYNDYTKTLFVPKIKLNDNSLPLDYENTKILDVPLIRVDSVEGTSNIGTRSYTITTKNNVGLGYAYFRIGSLYTYYSVAGDTTSSVTGTNQYSTQFVWRQYSISTATESIGLKTDYYESFSLPATNFNRTGNGAYNILTTKNTISVALGGTGIKTASYKNAVVIGNSTTVNSALLTVRTGAGGFYATATDAKPLFGILPLSVGGTGYSNYERPSDENYYYRGIVATTALPATLIPGGIVMIYGQVSEI